MWFSNGLTPWSAPPGLTATKSPISGLQDALQFAHELGALGFRHLREVKHAVPDGWQILGMRDLQLAPIT